MDRWLRAAESLGARPPVFQCRRDPRERPAAALRFQVAASDLRCLQRNALLRTQFLPHACGDRREAFRGDDLRGHLDARAFAASALLDESGRDFGRCGRHGDPEFECLTISDRQAAHPRGNDRRPSQKIRRSVFLLQCRRRKRPACLRRKFPGHRLRRKNPPPLAWLP